MILLPLHGQELNTKVVENANGKYSTPLGEHSCFNSDLTRWNGENGVLLPLGCQPFMAWIT